jgi:hypothetical protein
MNADKFYSAGPPHAQLQGPAVDEGDEQRSKPKLKTKRDERIAKDRKPEAATSRQQGQHPL